MAEILTKRLPDRYKLTSDRGRKTGIMVDESKLVKDVLGFETIDSFFAACYIPGDTVSPYEEITYESDSDDFLSPTKTPNKTPNKTPQAEKSAPIVEVAPVPVASSPAIRSPAARASPRIKSPAPALVPLAGILVNNAASDARPGSPAATIVDVVAQKRNSARKKRVSFAVDPMHLSFDEDDEKGQAKPAEPEKEVEKVKSPEAKKTPTKVASPKGASPAKPMSPPPNMDFGMEMPDMDEEDDHAEPADFGGNDFETPKPKKGILKNKDSTPDNDDEGAAPEEGDAEPAAAKEDDEEKKPKKGSKKGAKKSSKPSAPRQTAKTQQKRRQSVYLSPTGGEKFYALDEPDAIPENPDEIELGPGKYPKRKRVPPLQFWKGERVHYGRRPSTGQIGLVKIVKYNTPSPVPRKRGKRDDDDDEDEKAPAETPFKEPAKEAAKEKRGAKRPVEIDIDDLETPKPSAKKSRKK